SPRFRPFRNKIHSGGLPGNPSWLSVREELLGTSVRASGVEPAHAFCPGGVEHGVTAPLHLLGVVVSLEIQRVTECDVAGPAERGQAKSELGCSSSHDTIVSLSNPGWCCRR